MNRRHPERRVVQAERHRELVVDLRHHLFLQPLDDNFIAHGFAGLGRVFKILGKGFGRRPGVADRGSLEGLVDFRRNPVRSEHERGVLFGVGLFLAVFDLALEIDLDQHAVGGVRSLGRFPHGLFLGHLDELIVDLGGADLERNRRELERTDLRQLVMRPHLELGDESKPAVLRELEIPDLRVGEGPQVALTIQDLVPQNPGQVLPELFLDCTRVARTNRRGGSLAGPETRNAGRAADLAQDLLAFPGYSLGFEVGGDRHRVVRCSCH
jgi:hypothetical protein